MPQRLTRGLPRASCSSVPALALLLEVYSWVVLISVIGSWVRIDNPIFRLADQLTEPVLEPIRKVVPPVGGLDLSALILLIGIRLLAGVFR